MISFSTVSSSTVVLQQIVSDESIVLNEVLFEIGQDYSHTSPST